MIRTVHKWTSAYVTFCLAFAFGRIAPVEWSMVALAAVGTVAFVITVETAPVRRWQR